MVRGINYTLSHTEVEADFITPKGIQRGLEKAWLLQLSPVSNYALIY